MCGNRVLPRCWNKTKSEAHLTRGGAPVTGVGRGSCKWYRVGRYASKTGERESFGVSRLEGAHARRTWRIGGLQTQALPAQATDIWSKHGERRRVTDNGEAKRRDVRERGGGGGGYREMSDCQAGNWLLAFGGGRLWGTKKEARSWRFEGLEAKEGGRKSLGWAWLGDKVTLGNLTGTKVPLGGTSNGATGT